MTSPAADASQRPPASFGQVQTVLTVGFGLALITLLLLGWLSLQSARATLGNAREVTHTFELLGTLGTILAKVTDAETGSRGFVITGNDGFLEPYDSAVRILPGELTRLHGLLGTDDPQQRTHAARLDSLVAAKLSFIRLVTETRRDRGLLAASALVQTRRGKETMDGIRRTVAAIEAAQRGRLGADVASLQDTEQGLELAIILGTVAATLVAVLSMLAIRRELAARQRAELALRRSEQALRKSEDQLLQWVVGRRESPPREG